MNVVQAGPGEVASVAVLFDQYRQFYGREGDLAAAEAFIGQRLQRQDSVILLAQDKAGHALGFAQLYPSFTSVGMARIYVLNDLFVAPAQRRSGVGRALIGAARDVARDLGAVRLSLATARENEVAQLLYESVGFERDEKFYYYHLAIS